MELRGRRVDLSRIGCAVLNISGKKDHIVPISETEATTALARSQDKESLSLDAGHVGMLIGPGPRIYGSAFGTGSRLALASLPAPESSIHD